VQLRKVKKNDQSMKELLETYERIDDLAPSQIEYLHFALGKCYDDTNQHEKAFKHYQSGCELKRKRINYDPKQQSLFFDNLITIFDKAKIKSLRQFSNPSDLPIFVLGMPRSGTTLTEQIIASHPKVFGAGELRHFVDLVNKSVNTSNGQLFYPLNINLLSNEQIADIGTEYITRLRAYSPDAPHITDKMPGNFTNVGMIHALLPNAKIIHVVRNPFDNCLSCYTRLFQHGQSFTYDIAELGRYYADYRRLMQHWRKVLPKEAFLDVVYEDLVTDTEAQAKRIIDFCGLEWDANCLEFHKMERQVRTASVTQVRQPIYTTSVDRWKRFEKELQPLAIALGEEMK
jgi:tetratricopeptide (TPR) repeat protein